jgi:predicted Holliday junction resolvase-like endonuclease
MATKEELAALRAEIATKEELLQLERRLEHRLDTITEQMATKDSLHRLEVTMNGKFEQVYIRLDSIERGIGLRVGHIENEVSRLRSVVYLLIKDKPEMLRLLGPPVPGENRA